MDTIVYGTYTVQDLLIAAGVLVCAWIAFRLLKRLFKKKKTSAHLQIVECTDCGWQGQISRYVGRCPVCNSPLGSQKAR